MAKLIVNPDTPNAWEIPLQPGTISLGRAPENDFPIEHSSVSHNHCQVTVTSSGMRIKDLGSSAGTFVDGALVEETKLRSGQTIRLGEIVMRLEADPAEHLETAQPDSVVVAGASCKFHPRSPATWTCAKCRAYYCDLCVSARGSAQGFGHFCRRCGTECLPVVAQPDEPAKQSFFKMLPEAFRYPYKGNGPILLAAGTIAFAFLDSIASFAAIGLYGGIFILLASGFITAYVFSYAKKIIVSTVNGDAAPPDWPDFSNWEEDIASPFGQCIALIILAFGPAMVLRWWHPFGESHAEIVVLIAMLVGGVLAPMGMLALAMFDSVGALNPIALIWSILRIPGPYLVAAATFEMVTVVYFIVGHWIGRLLPVPFLSGLIGGFLNLYLITAGMRILGLLYIAKERELGWFRRGVAIRPRQI